MDNLEISNIEMIVLLTNYKNHNKLKIKKISKMNRSILIENCAKYNLIETRHLYSNVIDYNLLTKKQLFENIQTFYSRKGLYIDKIEKLNKETLIQLMIDQKIPHITKDDVKKEIKELERYNAAIDIINYNHIKFDNIPQSDMINLLKIYSIEEIENYIIEKNLDTNLYNLDNITELVDNLYNIYKTYCEKSNIKINNNKTLPSLITSISILNLD